MFCKNCGNKIDTDSRFCSSCGHEIPIQSQIVGTNLSTCEICGVYAPVKYVEFYQNIGMLLARTQQSVKGKLCKNCINKYFKKFTLTSLFLGWWGVISFFATALFIINNIFRYLTTLSLEYPRN